MTKSYDSIQRSDQEGWENSSLFCDGKPFILSTLHMKIIAEGKFVKRIVDNLMLYKRISNKGRSVPPYKI